MIRHALAEGWLLLRQRGAVSLVLALVLAVPISLAGMGLTLRHWLGPMVGLSGQSSTVAVLLHPRLDNPQRRKWIADESAAHPEWSISEVSNEDLVNRLGRWFPYLDELVASGDASLPPLIEIVTAVPESVAVLEDRRDGQVRGVAGGLEGSLHKGTCNIRQGGPPADLGSTRLGGRGLGQTILKSEHTRLKPDGVYIGNVVTDDL